MEAAGILMNCAVLLAHVLSLTISSIALILLLYRFRFNRLHQRHVGILVCSSMFNDNTAILLLANTYAIFVIYHIAWLSLSLRTFIGDFSLLTGVLDLGDSVICRLQVGVIFFVTTSMYHSFFLQTLYRFIRVIFVFKLNTLKLWGMPLASVRFYILLIVLCWLLAILVLIPAYHVFDVFTYFPEQYHCLISFFNVRGFIYSLLVSYLVPTAAELYMYARVILHIRRLSTASLRLRTRRDVAIIKRIVITCASISVLGFPTLFFLFQAILTGRMHPLADRIHELGVAINGLAFTFSFAVLNSLMRILPERSTTCDSSVMMMNELQT